MENCFKKGKLSDLVNFLAFKNKILSYREVKNELREATERTTKRYDLAKAKKYSGQSKEIYIFAGPNGSGKSTMISKCLKVSKCPPNYICPDFLLGAESIGTKEEYVRAMRKAADMRDAYIESGASITLETVLSSREKIEFLRRAKERGYEITMIYVTTSHPSINVGRVAQRVIEGGHDVPVPDIIRRYHKSMGFLPEAMEISDNYAVLDNSGAEPISVIECEKGHIILNSIYADSEWLTFACR